MHHRKQRLHIYIYIYIYNVYVCVCVCAYIYISLQKPLLSSQSSILMQNRISSVLPLLYVITMMQMWSCDMPAVSLTPRTHNNFSFLLQRCYLTIYRICPKSHEIYFFAALLLVAACSNRLGEVGGTLYICFDNTIPFSLSTRFRF